MKKYLIIILTFLFLFSFSIPTMAKTLPQDINVSLSASSVQVNVNEEVLITAVTPKHGSSYDDQWYGSELISTNLENDNYVSVSTFTADTPGTYTVSYDIEMTAGKSHSVFKGTQNLTIEVIDSKTIKEVSIENIVFLEVINADGTIVSYNAIGEIIVTLNNGETINYGTIFTTLGKDVLSKDVDVTIDLHGEQHIYTVTVSR